MMICIEYRNIKTLLYGYTWGNEEATAKIIVQCTSTEIMIYVSNAYMVRYFQYFEVIRPFDIEQKKNITK